MLKRGGSQNQREACGGGRWQRGSDGVSWWRERDGRGSGGGKERGEIRKERRRRMRVEILIWL